MIIEEVAPTLTCVQSNDGFLYELVLRAKEGLKPITKIRIGPYFFKAECQPRSSFLGFSSGGPENAFWMHKRTPGGWSRFHWEIVDTDEGKSTYLVSEGILNPGTQGLFQFVSFYPPGGLRAGLEIYRGEEHYDCGVTGPNYEKFLEGDHEHG